MQAFTTLTGIAAPLPKANVDTDQIIPAVYLKRVTRTGFEDGLFSAWRNDPTFILNTVPFDHGSVRVRLQAEEEGLDVVFKEAGGEWRGAGCSMCLGMNPDQLTPGERSASTSNRNFEGRQGKGGRTHLVSVPVAAATAVRGTLSSPADLTPIG